jgi:hypothetical protein
LKIEEVKRKKNEEKCVLQFEKTYFYLELFICCNLDRSVELHMGAWGKI